MSKPTKEIEKLEKDIRSWVDQAKSAKSELRERWEQVDQMYYKGIPGTLNAPWPDAPDYPYPVAKTRMDQVTAFVVGSLTKNDPFILVRGSGEVGKWCNGVQSCLHFFLKDAEYQRVLREAVNVIQRRGTAIVRPSFVLGYERKDELPVRAKIKLDVIDPNDVVVYPNWATEWDDMLMIGNRYEVSKAYVEQKIKDKKFFKVNVQESQDEERDIRPSKYNEEDSTDDDNGAVTLYDLYINTPEGVKRAVWCEGSNKLLSYEPFGMAEPPLIRLFLHSEDNRYYNETSRGYDLVAVQQYEQDLRNMIVWGGINNIFPTVFGQGTSLEKTVEKAKPGAFIKYRGTGQLWSPPARADVSAIAALLPISSNDADMVSKVGQMGMGTSMRGSQTATEANAVYQGQMTGVSEDSANLSIGLAKLAKHVVELLYWHFDKWYPDYQAAMPLVEQDHFGFPYTYEVNGETATNTPQAIAMQVSQLMTVLPQMLQQEMALAQMSAQFAIDPMTGQPTGIQPYVPFLLKMPDFVPELIRALIDSSQLPAKETIIPPRQELENDETGDEGVLQDPGMAMLAGLLPQTGGFGNGDANQLIPPAQPGVVLPEPSEAPDADEPI